jgi:Uma2 family endonuclease
MSVGTVAAERAEERRLVGDGRTASDAGKLLTVEEFLALCERPEYADRQLELDEGRLVVMPPAGDQHGTLSSWISAILWEYAKRSGVGRVASNDPGLLLSRDPDTVRAPDLAYYRENVRLEEISPGPPKRLPDLVVEVLSPSDRLGMVMRKVQQYLRAGIAMVWVVDGESRNVTVYRSGREPRVLEENEVLDGEDVLPGFTCAVSELFRLPGTVMGTTAVSTGAEATKGEQR